MSTLIASDDIWFVLGFHLISSEHLWKILSCHDLRRLHHRSCENFMSRSHGVPARSWWSLFCYRSLIVLENTYNILYSIYAYRHFCRDDHIYRRPLVFYKSSDILITFIDSPSSTRSLKLPMITIVIDIIILSLPRLVCETVRNMDLEKKKIDQRTCVASFLSSWSMTRIQYFRSILFGCAVSQRFFW